MTAALGADAVIVLTRWSRAGPASDLAIEKIDQIGGRERFSVTVSLAHSGLVDWRPRDRRFFIVALEDGSPRITEIATALGRP
jgi:hypothetical protein